MEIKSVTASVVDYLKKEIITGELKAGQKLSEAGMAMSLNVSRTALREAYRILEKENLIVNIPRRGTKVSEISADDLKRSYHARRMIEYYAIDLLEMENMRNLPHARECLERESKLSRPSYDDREEYYRYVLTFAEFHVRMIEATGNGWLIEFFESITSHLARYQLMYLYIPGSGDRSAVEHEEILACIEAGNYKKARALMVEHIDYTYNFLRHKILETKEGERYTENAVQ